MVRGVPPFPGVRECLERLSGRTDILVVSATPHQALRSEWEEHGIARFVRAICGQEQGSKKEHLSAATHYPQGAALMIGDAPSDWQAAAANGCLFFPINPGGEEASWSKLLEEGIPRFLEGRFTADYQTILLAEFDKRLPSCPPWAVV
jgi:phosphoglycolate phosphatase-like HAD superfamily hydrolase